MNGPAPNRSLAAVVASMVVLLSGPGARPAEAARARIDKRVFTTQFRLEDCTFESEGSANPFFILSPGHRLVLRGEERQEEVEVQITVLADTEDVEVPGLGVVRTRVVEEREWENGELAEVSRNFFALCRETRDVFYFGEDVDDYEGGMIVGHDGAWRAGIEGARPGLIMPGRFLLGSRYFQEIAPGVAMDRGENQAMELQITVPAGNFSGCVSVVETSALEPGTSSFKAYAPGVGLVIDDTLRLDSWTPAP